MNDSVLPQSSYLFQSYTLFFGICFYLIAEFILTCNQRFLQNEKLYPPLALNRERTYIRKIILNTIIMIFCVSEIKGKCEEIKNLDNGMISKPLETY